jgi:hypothetical protein
VLGKERLWIRLPHVRLRSEFPRADYGFGAPYAMALGGVCLVALTITRLWFVGESPR